MSRRNNPCDPPHPPTRVVLNGRVRRRLPYAPGWGWRRGSTNGREFLVRCRCMAGTHYVPSRNFYGYDPIAVVRDAAEARRVWEDHRAAQRAA